MEKEVLLEKKLTVRRPVDRSKTEKVETAELPGRRALRQRAESL